jgi:hypothetical protein
MLFSLFNQLLFLKLYLFLFVNVQMPAVIFCKSVYYAVRFSYVLALWCRVMEVIFTLIQSVPSFVCMECIPAFCILKNTV